MVELDTHDLYPPDAEDDELTASVREHRKRVVIGTALVVWGTSLLVERALGGVDLDTWWLGIGLAALAGWTQVRRYNWFVAGSILTGLGVGELLSGPFDNAFGASLALLCLAAGFAAVYVRYPRRSSWAVPVAGVLALIAVGALGIGLIGLVPAVLGRFLLPLLLIGGGGLLLARHSLPPKTVRVGLAALAVAFVLVGATSVPDIDHDPSPPFLDGPMGGELFQPLPLAAGQTLTMIEGTSGDIELRTASDGMASIETRGPRHRRGGIGFTPTPTGVVVDDGADVDYVVSLPEGVRLDVVRTSGSVSGEVPAGVSGSIRTGSGDVELDLLGEGSVEGKLEIETGSGSVDVESDAPLDLDLAGDGDVVVNGADRDGRFRSPQGTLAMELEVDAQSGDIEVDAPQPSTEEPSETIPG